MNAWSVGLTIVVGLCGISYALSNHDLEPVRYVADNDRSAELEARIVTLEQQLEHLQKSHETAFSADSQLFDTIGTGFEQIESRMTKLEKWSKDYVAYHNKRTESYIEDMVHAQFARLDLGRQSLALAGQMKATAIILGLVNDDPEFTQLADELEANAQAMVREIQSLLEQDKAYPGNRNRTVESNFMSN
jgi:BMFP domain-containing protein YqiC